MFLDKYYIYLDTDEKYYLIDLESKSGQPEKDIEKHFLNEALIQSARYSVMQQAKTIRELILGRAFASTIKMIQIQDLQTIKI